MSITIPIVWVFISIINAVTSYNCGYDLLMVIMWLLSAIVWFCYIFREEE
jgi:hypothetical protein